VEWTLGGKQSSWSLDNNTQFSWQHDARWVTEGSVISLFDDASALLRSAMCDVCFADFFGQVTEWLKTRPVRALIAAVEI
jgi:hypothetical protein